MPGFLAGGRGTWPSVQSATGGRDRQAVADSPLADGSRLQGSGPLLSTGLCSQRLGVRIRTTRPVAASQLGVAAEKSPLPGGGARVDKRAGDRTIQDESAHWHVALESRPAAVVSRASDRDSRCGSHSHGTSGNARSARYELTGLHGLGAARGGGPVCRAGALARGRGPVRLYTRFPRSRRRATVLLEEKRLGVDVLDAIVVRVPRDHVDLPGSGSLLVPQLRPGPGQEDPGKLQEDAA